MTLAEKGHGCELEVAETMLAVTMPKDLAERIKRFAGARGESIQAEIRRALREYIEAEERRQRELSVGTSR